ncbi:MAG TPA: outer membrane protein transport protein [Kiritimatiellia bacterium]|nr:outer membrane protein transport protein [Kiritimatiellia bacterium]
MNKTSIKAIVSATLTFGLSASLFADGFRNPPEGASALGRIGGRIAYTEDASAIAHNPANLVDLDQPSAYLSLTLGYSKMKFEAPDGRSTSSRSPWALLPNLFAATPLGEDGWAFGIGLTSPYGRSTELPEDSPFRYSAPYYTQLMSANVAPTVAKRLNERLSVGFGVNFLYTDLEFRQIYPWGVVLGNPALPDGRNTISADGYGVGAAAAITYAIRDNQRIALTYRSPIKVDLEGSFRITDIPVDPVRGPAGAPRSDFESDITFPMVIAFAYGIQLTDKLTLEANIEWARQSSFDKLDLDAGINQPLLPSDSIETDWNDNWTYGLSALYQIDDQWVLRAGYIYLESPVPSRTMLPTTAEEDQSVVSIGVGYTSGNHRLDATYSLGLFNGRRVTNSDTPDFNGKYDFEAHLFSLAYALNF